MGCTRRGVAHMELPLFLCFLPITLIFCISTLTKAGCELISYIVKPIRVQSVKVSLVLLGVYKSFLIIPQGSSMSKILL